MKLSLKLSTLAVLFCAALPALAKCEAGHKAVAQTQANTATTTNPASTATAKSTSNGTATASNATAGKVLAATNKIVIPSPATAANSCNIKDYGAKSGSDIGPAINNAFTKCVTASGAKNKVLLIPQGNWIIRSHVVLNGGENWALQWDGNVSIPHDTSIGGGPMIQFKRAKNFVFTGKGAFYGGGVNWRAQSMGDERPRMLSFYKCSHTEITGVHLDDSPMFHISLSECDNVQVHDIVISSPPPYKGTTDAVDVSCTDCQIWNMDITNGDDSIVMKSPAHNVEVWNATIRHGYGIGIGTVGKTGVFDITNIHATDIKLIDATAGQYTKSYPGATGVIRNVTVENVTCQNVAKPIAVDQYWQGGSLDTPDANAGDSKLVISDFTFRNWSGTGDSTTRPTIYLNGSPASPQKNMVFENVKLTKEGGRTPTITINHACGSGLSQLSACSKKARRRARDAARAAGH
nr:putative glycoside hydrolase family 28 protein [Thecaphora frezii]